MDLSYALTPFIAWTCAGAMKFAINSLRAKRLAFDLIGYGGLPSNHAAICGSVTALIAFREGIAHPAFGVAVAFTFIVLLDANSLRKQVGLQAQALNRIAQRDGGNALRERIGHSRIELLAGLLVGAMVAWAINQLL